MRQHMVLPRVGLTVCTAGTFVCAALSAAVVATAPLDAQPADRTQPPRLAEPSTLALPVAESRVLPNGLRLVFLRQDELPLVDIAIVLGNGTETDPAGKAGLASLTASLLREGTTTRLGTDIADQQAFLGVRLSASASFDRTVVSLHTPTAVLDSALALMTDIVRRPSFADDAFTRVKSETQTALLQLRDRAPAIADRAFANIVFGAEHPYGRPGSGTDASVAAITREDVANYWRTWYRPGNATLFVVGDLTLQEAETLAAAAFGDWESATVPTVQVPAPPATPARGLFLIDKPGAPQSSFRLGGVGVARNTDDYYPLMVLNTILGGSFTSRLNNTLRETKGYTYGAGSRFDMRRAAGPFVARAEIVAEKSDSALIEFLRELREIRDVVPDGELTKAKQLLVLGFPGEFETTSDLVDKFSTLATYGLPLDGWNSYQRGILAVSASDVQRVAQKYITPDQMAIVITGDLARIEAGIRAVSPLPVQVLPALGDSGTSDAGLRSGGARAASSASADSALTSGASATRTSAPSTREPLLVDVPTVAALRDRPDVVILQVGTPAQFDSAHVPGARAVALSSVSTPRTPGALILELPSDSALLAWAHSVGVSDDSRIILVPSDDAVQSTTRVFLTLEYMGAGARTSILNGGLIAWRAAGQPVASGADAVNGNGNGNGNANGNGAAARPGSASFTMRRDSSIIATMAAVDAAIADPRTAVIDARTPNFYNGNGGGYPRPGHIPTAINIPLTTVSANGMFKSPAELQSLFDAAGVKPDQPVITYCHIGQQATVLWFVARLLGYDARMYDGSFQEWSGSTKPLEAGSASPTDR